MEAKTLKVELHFPWAAWGCSHGWDEIKEGPCPACHGVCLVCGKPEASPNFETGFCADCQTIFES